ncbi:MAG TPA: RDD family protein, partial [Pyrinomonadaceae bacterium]|nr:RDD family protein [Pyrinomonadaceae bacterium]
VLSVKAIDARTGLIPTGGQSIKRAFGYVFSFAILGLGFAFAFVDRDHRTLHDRFSRTIVVHN